MRYTISGADRDTGEEMEITVSATDERAAQEVANRKGILVARISGEERREPGHRVSQEKVYVEGTSKKIKLYMLLSALVAIAGWPVAIGGVFLNAANNSPNPIGAITVVGIFLICTGLLAFIVLRLVRWWHHG